MNAALASAAVVVRRTIDASPDDLFDAWLDPHALTIWMRPGSIRETRVQVDARVGGAYEITMHGDSTPIVHHGVYVAIDRPRKLVFTWISQPTENQETLVTVEFLPQKQGTEVVITHEKLPESARAGHVRGWTGCLEQLVQTTQQGLIASRRSS